MTLMPHFNVTYVAKLVM